MLTKSYEAIVSALAIMDGLNVHPEMIKSKQLEVYYKPCNGNNFVLDSTHFAMCLDKCCIRIVFDEELTSRDVSRVGCDIKQLGVNIKVLNEYGGHKLAKNNLNIVKLRDLEIHLNNKDDIQNIQSRLPNN